MICSTCKFDFPVSDFRKQTKAKSGFNTMCRRCINIYQKNWRKNNPEKVHKYSRMGQLRRQYGITLEDYNNMLVEQENVCFICKSPDPGRHRYFHVDHCHKTNKIRKLLCEACNLGLGLFKDRVEVLQAAANYILLHEHLKERDSF